VAKKKVVKRARKIARARQEPKTYASIYAATLARQVAAELKPLQPARRKGRKAR
jgi:hypothetical protein